MIGRTLVCVMLTLLLAASSVPCFNLSARALAQTPERAAPDPAAVLIEQLSKNKHVLKIENGKPTGPGAELLLREARASQFFLVGEDHGLAEVPQFVESLLPDLKTHGYRYFAVETGPVTARLLEKTSSGPNPQKTLGEFLKQYPYSLPFFFWREEGRMLAEASKSFSAKPGFLWGLDQEFVLSPEFHLVRLKELAPNPPARQAADRLLEKVRLMQAEAVKQKNPGAVFLMRASEDDFQGLEKAFNAKPGSEADVIARELRASWEIYNKFGTGKGWESNAQRSELMKRHFREAYDAALKRDKQLPKVLFKLGANHMQRGRTQTNVFDIGNLASELATMNGSKSFHVMVIGLAGTQNRYFPFVGNPADKAKKYGVSEALEFDASPLVAAADAKDWTVIDLRPLRPKLHAGKFGKLSRGLIDLIWTYDSVVLVPEVSASTFFDQ